jgi:hypothetical protein
MHTHVITHECITHPHTKTIDPPLADVIDRSCGKFNSTQMTNPITQLNHLAIELIANVNQKPIEQEHIDQLWRVTKEISQEMENLNNHHNENQRSRKEAAL